MGKGHKGRFKSERIIIQKNQRTRKELSLIMILVLVCGILMMVNIPTNVNAADLVVSGTYTVSGGSVALRWIANNHSKHCLKPIMSTKESEVRV